MQLADGIDRKTRLLVVEDDVQLVDYLSALFSDFADRLEIRCALDGFEAGRLTESWRPDIMLLDLMLPGIDGFELCARIKRDPATAAIRVVAMTGYPTPENVRRMIEVGAEHCLAKPFRRIELLDALGFSESTEGASRSGAGDG
jgi:CheY-like chemotaxis protein